MVHNNNLPRPLIQKHRQVKSKGALLVLLLSVFIDSDYLSTIIDIWCKYISNIYGTINNIASLILNFESDPLQFLVAVILLGIAIPQLFYTQLLDGSPTRVLVDTVLSRRVCGYCTLGTVSYSPASLPSIDWQRGPRLNNISVAYMIINVGLAGVQNKHHPVWHGPHCRRIGRWERVYSLVPLEYVRRYSDMQRQWYLVACTQIFFFLWLQSASMDSLRFSGTTWFIKEPKTKNSFKTVYNVLLCTKVQYTCSYTCTVHMHKFSIKDCKLTNI